MLTCFNKVVCMVNTGPAEHQHFSFVIASTVACCHQHLVQSTAVPEHSLTELLG